MISSWLGKFTEFFGVGQGNEVFDSTELALKDRLSSPFYGYFILFWSLINWRIIYAALFIDQDILLKKTGLMRNQYIDAITPNWHQFMFWWTFFIAPVLLMFFAFWVMPYATRLFFRKNLKNGFALKIIELTETTKATQAKSNLVQQETALIKSEIKKAQEEKKAEEETPEVVWEREFRTFRHSRFFKKFKQIIDVVYEYRGRMSPAQPGSQVERDVLVYTDSNGLVILKPIDFGGTEIQLTDKGKYFVKKFSELDSLGVI